MVETDRVQQHLLSLGFKPNVVNPFIERLETWVKESGMEWTVQRFKSLKLYFLHQLEGKIPPIPEGWAVYHTRHRIVFRDPMVRMVMDLPNVGVHLLRKEGFIRLFQIFKLKKVTEKQTEKYIQSITLPYSGSSESLEEAKALVLKGIKKILLDGSVSREEVGAASFTPLRLWSESEKRAPTLITDKVDGVIRFKLKSMRRDESIKTHNFVDIMSRDSMLQSLWRTYPFDVSRCMVGAGEAILIQSQDWREMIDVPAGRIGNIQEGGCKLRTVANPFLALQALGEPLKRKLEMLTKDFSEVATFDQSSSHDTIVQWLISGCEIASYDLTAFTDRFPYELQRVVLQTLREEGYISQFDYDVMQLVVQKEWVSAGSKLLKWEVGQPMGFGPSFHLATLTHLALLRGLGCRLCRIVGDDVVINDSRCATRYEVLMTSLGVEVSLAKSLISNQFAEFCGKILSAGGVNPSIKLKHIESEDQIVRLIGYYGPRAFDFLSHSEWNLARKVMLPVDLGGLGEPLPGESYSEYLSALNTDLIADSCLRSSLQEALGLSNYGKMQGVFEWLQAFDAENLLIDQHSDGVSGVSSKGVTGITTSNLFTHGRVEGDLHQAYRHMTAAQMIDDHVRNLLSHDTKIPKWVKVFYFSPCGYSTERREAWGKALKSDIIRSTKNDGENRHQSSNRFFKGKGYENT